MIIENGSYYRQTKENGSPDEIERHFGSPAVKRMEVSLKGVSGRLKPPGEVFVFTLERLYD